MLNQTLRRRISPFTNRPAESMSYRHPYYWAICAFSQVFRLLLLLYLPHLVVLSKCNFNKAYCAFHTYVFSDGKIRTNNVTFSKLETHRNFSAQVLPSYYYWWCYQVLGRGRVPLQLRKKGIYCLRVKLHIIYQACISELNCHISELKSTVLYFYDYFFHNI